MKVLLTGFTGFVGKAVYKKLACLDIDLHVISRYSQPSIKNSAVLDILDHAATHTLISKINPDVLIHLAWDVSHDEYWHSTKNTHYADASIHLFSCFIKNGGKKIIATGTCAEYPTSNHPMHEDMDINPDTLTHYGREKQRVSHWLKHHGGDYAWLRIFGIYGEDEDPRRFFPSMLRAIQEEKDFVIKNPSSFYDYIQVKDVALLVQESLTRENVGVINTGSGQSYSTLDLYQSIQRYIKSGHFFLNRTITTPDKNSRIPDCSKLKAMGINFSLNFSLDTQLT